MKRETGMCKKISLKRFAYSFLLLFFLSSLLFGMLIIYKVAVSEPEKQIFLTLEELSSDHSDILVATNNINKIINQIQQKFLWALIVCLLAGSIVFFLIICTIISYLDNVRKAAARMVDGHLDETVDVYRFDEIDSIGKIINNFAVNLQEVLLLLWNQTQNCLRYLNQMSQFDETNPEKSAGLNDKLQHMQHGLEDMQTMIRSFNFYGVCLEESKLMMRQKQQDKFPNRTGDSND